MTIIPKLLLSASALFILSCSEGENTKYRKAENNTQPTPGEVAKPAQPVTNPAQTGTPGTAVALNPPHGQPNHRCDIPEGAPLNAPMQPNLKAAAPQFKPLPQGSAVAPGTNPPHGQPGHDCAIAVGAPLNK